MMNKVVRPARPHAARRSHRSRRLHLESLESRKLLASVITGMTATPVAEGNATTLTVNFTEPATLANTYRFNVDWGDGSAAQTVNFTPTVLNPATGEMQATFTHNYADDNATDSYAIRGAVIDSSMVSYWNFDEAAGPTAVDLFGNNNGTLEGSVTRVAGLIGPGAIVFNNAGGDSVNVGASATFSVTNGLAVEALIRPTWDGNAYDEIFRKEDGGNRILFAFQNDPNNGGAQPAVAAGPVLSLGLNIGGYNELDMPLNVDLSALPGGNASSGTIYLNPPGGALGPNDVVLKDNATHHVVGTYDVATGVKAIWVDGVMRWSFNYAPGTPIASGGGTPAYIGNTAGGGEPYTNVMDEVAFYNRALSAQAVADHRAQSVAGSNYFAKTTTVTVTNAPPVFEAGADANLNEGATLSRGGTATDVATDTLTATVNYGDGSGTQPLALVGGNYSLTHTYANQGTFAVTVIVSDEDGGSTVDAFVVNVANVVPVIDSATATTPIAEGSSTNLSIGFTDPGTADVHSAIIDWGDGSPAQTVNVALGLRTVAASHVYANDGIYPVTFTINDGTGSSLAGSVSVTVTNVAPTVGAISGTATVNEGSPASIAVGFTDPGLTETFTATIDWGDGNTTPGVVNQATRTVTGSHVYVNQGFFNVVVLVNDGIAASPSAPFVVTVNNVLPVIGASTGTSPIAEGSSTTLAIGFTDPGTADVHSATINWGDGSPAQTVNVALGQRSVAAGHVYANDGVYPVTFTINDDSGSSLPGSVSITVINVQPTLDAGAVISGDEGSSVSLAASFVDPGLLDSHTATIDWGDASPLETILLPVGARTIAGSHVYADNGNYTVTVTVTDGQSPVVTDTTLADIANVAPTVTIIGPDSTVRGLPTTYTFSADDPSAVDLLQPYTYLISWGDGTADQEIIGPASGIDVVHVFPVTSPTDAPYIVSATATDIDGDTGAATEFEVTVVPFDVVFNNDTGLFDLVYGGTQYADRIVFSMLYSGALQIRNNSTFYRNIPDFDGKIIVYGGDGADQITVAGHVPYQFEMYGGNGNDYLAGGGDDDILDGGAGNDRLIDNRGNNTFYGGAGNDTISSGAGDDVAFGGDGNDRITGGFGNDILDGEAGNDNIVGSDGDDILFGGAGNDILRGDRGDDIIDGGLSNDAIHGLSGRDILIGGRGADAIYGGVDDDLIVHSNVDFGNAGSLTEREDDIAALLLIQQMWIAPSSLDDRIADIEGTLNDSTIPDDNSRDSIFGDGDEDWFLIASMLEIRRLQEWDQFTLLYS